MELTGPLGSFRLIACCLPKIVDGTEILAEGAGADARAAFGRRSQKAFSVIVLVVNSSQLYLVMFLEGGEYLSKEFNSYLQGKEFIMN